MVIPDKKKAAPAPVVGFAMHACVVEMPLAGHPAYVHAAIVAAPARATSAASANSALRAMYAGARGGRARENRRAQRVGGLPK